ncbi:NAD(P)-dependent alcohol dehydrogenase [Pseudozobellia thermophila]|uniref:NADPH:quinone reductase n=1 Tax=Pseudozobellia thermophila TaxID=192903 RepID=A0A1M6MMS2_9FLAO|nr:NAD(P)-dependent alcohol dehydrogenase [Pseudozobellia thermophila]SHJ84752.1 NADPH:quinone reductase [Pseudozobellia thermophila]
MKALTYSRYGKPSAIFEVKHVNTPEPREDELLVKVYASTVNRTDEGLVTARYFVSRVFTGLFRPKKQIPGTDFAGRIEKTGEKVKNFKVGDRVFGFNDEILSSHAEYLVIKEDGAVLPMPENAGYKSATACCEGAHYALNFINKTSISAGQKVLVNGATGAIGTAVVQLLYHKGVEVTATANTKNRELVKTLGATTVIDFTKEDFTRQTVKYDFIFDAVGKSTFLRCKPLLKPRGVYISSELGPYGSNLFWALFTPIIGGKKVIFPVPVKVRESLLTIKKLMENDQFSAVIDRTYSLDDIIEAYEYVALGQKTGSVVIEMASP